MRKIGTIAWKELYVTFTDRNTVLIMIATPLAVAIIIGLAFSRFASNDVPVSDVPVAVVNFDQGNAFGTNFGQIFVSALVPDARGAEEGENPEPICDLTQQAAEETSASEDATSIDIFELTDAVAFDAYVAESLVDSGAVGPPDSEPGSEEYVLAVAKKAVESGEYTAAIVIPGDFSRKISYVPGLHPQLEQTGISVYANSGRQVSAEIIRSIAQGITNQILTGNIAMAATVETLEASGDARTVAQAESTPDLAAAFACAFTPATNTVRLDPQTVGGAATDNAGIRMLFRFGSAQAMFFGLFTASFGVLSMYDERRNWTLQRLVMSPTPRSVILSGKLIGVSGSVLFQILILMLALSLAATILAHEMLFIWGTDLVAGVLVLLSVTLAVSGFGMFLAGIVKTPEQGQVFGGLVTLGLAVLGGSFGFTLPPAIGMFSIIYWGRVAFEKLATGQGGVGLNIAVLAVQGAILFALGVVIFNRRFEVT